MTDASWVFLVLGGSDDIQPKGNGKLILMLGLLTLGVAGFCKCQCAAALCGGHGFDFLSLWTLQM